MVNQNLSASVILLFLNMQLKTKRVSPHFFSLILPYGHFSGMLSNYTDLPFLFLPTIFNLFFRSVHSVPLCGPYWKILKKSVLSSSAFWIHCSFQYMKHCLRCSLMKAVFAWLCWSNKLPLHSSGFRPQRFRWYLLAPGVRSSFFSMCVFILWCRLKESTNLEHDS